MMKVKVGDIGYAIQRPLFYTSLFSPVKVVSVGDFTFTVLFPDRTTKAFYAGGDGEGWYYASGRRYRTATMQLAPQACGKEVWDD